MLTFLAMLIRCVLIIVMLICCVLIMCDALLSTSVKNLIVGHLTQAVMSGASFSLFNIIFGVACASTVAYFATFWTRASLWMHVSWAAVCLHVCAIVIAYMLLMAGPFRDAAQFCGTRNIAEVRGNLCEGVGGI